MKARQEGRERWGTREMKCRVSRVRGVSEWEGTVGDEGVNFGGSQWVYL